MDRNSLYMVSPWPRNKRYINSLMECMIYSSKYEVILKIMLLYLVERYGGMLSRSDFFIRDS